MVEKNPITPEGAQKLRDELHHRKTTERNLVSKMIGVAREHGDLKENAEYHAARERGGFNEGRIKELEDKIGRAEVIDPAKLVNGESEEEVTYRIVGADECDINAGSISITSPLARSLIGKEVGDEAKTRTPAGERVFEILEVVYK